MSGGAFDYFSYTMADHARDFTDPEIQDLMQDLSDLHHALEWWQSGDTDRDRYQDALEFFKAKWFEQDRSDRLIKYMDVAIDRLRVEMKEMIG